MDVGIQGKFTAEYGATWRDHRGLEHPETTSGRKFVTQSKRTIILIGKIKLRPPPLPGLGLCLSGGITPFF